MIAGSELDAALSSDATDYEALARVLARCDECIQKLKRPHDKLFRQPGSPKVDSDMAMAEIDGLGLKAHLKLTELIKEYLTDAAQTRNLTQISGAIKKALVLARSELRPTPELIT